MQSWCRYACVTVSTTQIRGNGIAAGVSHQGTTVRGVGAGGAGSGVTKGLAENRIDLRVSLNVQWALFVEIYADLVFLKVCISKATSGTCDKNVLTYTISSGAWAILTIHPDSFRFNVIPHDSSRFITIQDDLSRISPMHGDPT